MTLSFTVKLKTNIFWGYREAEISENGKPVYRMICNKHRGLKFDRDYSLETAGGKKVLDLQEMKINGKLVYEISKNQSTLCRVTGHVPYGGSFDRFEMKTFDSRLPSHAAKIKGSWSNGIFIGGSLVKMTDRTYLGRQAYRVQVAASNNNNNDDTALLLALALAVDGIGNQYSKSTQVGIIAGAAAI